MAMMTVGVNGTARQVTEGYIGVNGAARRIVSGYVGVNGVARKFYEVSSGPPEIVSWSSGTDAQIAAMVAAMDAGTLSIAETGWQVGDERSVSLSAMSATGVGRESCGADSNACSDGQPAL